MTDGALDAYYAFMLKPTTAPLLTPGLHAALARLIHLVSATQLACARVLLATTAAKIETARNLADLARRERERQAARAGVLVLQQRREYQRWEPVAVEVVS